MPVEIVPRFMSSSLTGHDLPPNAKAMFNLVVQAADGALHQRTDLEIQPHGEWEGQRKNRRGVVLTEREEALHVSL